VLYSFTGGTDGSEPVGGLTIDTSGNLYGTTEAAAISLSNAARSSSWRRRRATGHHRPAYL